MANPKVFEFAKEIGVETITLMDKLRKWEIPVKSHMAALSPDMVESIRDKLKNEDAPADKTTKKKAAKKKTKTAAKKKTVAKKKTASATKGKKVVKKKAASAGTEDDVKKSSRKVIRRKAGAADQAAKAAEALAAKKKEEEAAAEEKLEAVAAEQIAATEAATTNAEAVESGIAETESSVENKETIGDSAVKDSAEKAKPEEAKAAEPATPSRRTKILGRVDLSKVQPKRRPQSAPRGDRPSSGPRTSSAPNMAAANVVDPSRAGDDRKSKGSRFKAVEIGPRADAKAAAEKKKKGKNQTAGENLGSFNRTEFRKREIVFQPKKRMTDLGRDAMKTVITTPKASKMVVRVHGKMTVNALAEEMKVKSGKLISFLMKQGIMAKANEELDFETISLISPEFGFDAENTFESVDELLEKSAHGEVDADLVQRAPVVTVMGHVDHGKTSLLDSIRKTNVTDGEAGGITQHIGAYRVQLDGGKPITFLDTPGHAAFTEMRARGASVTDIAVIVVAADDGLMPQTKEAINHAKAAGVPIIVAVNKMDRPNANPEKIKQQLTEFELIPEEWGGSTMFIETVAPEGKGIKEILEAIELQSEMLELKSNPKRSCTGVVIESKLQKGRGIVATLLIKDGTLKKGQYVVAGKSYGRIKAMLDDKGKPMKEAGPGVPVEILGLNDSPAAGDPVGSTEKERQAAEIANRRVQEEKDAAKKSKSSNMSLEELFGDMNAGNVKELPIVLKTDVSGSGEAIKNLFANEKSEKVKINVIHSAVGGITESDILLASTAQAMVIGFNVGTEGSAGSLAKKEGIQLKRYSIIYELADDIRKAMKGLLDPDIVEESQGAAEVRETFKVPTLGMIAGCMVTDGKVLSSSLVRLFRDGKQIYEGNVTSLRRFKDNAKEVASGYECGIGIENYNDLKVGDKLEFYQKKEVEAEL
ncbi:MAG: translation initiation factor IF-2 [Bdellovibrionales bacterium]